MDHNALLERYVRGNDRGLANYEIDEEKGCAVVDFYAEFLDGDSHHDDLSFSLLRRIKQDVPDLYLPYISTDVDRDCDLYFFVIRIPLSSLKYHLPKVDETVRRWREENGI